MAALFRENGIDFDKVNYFIEPLPEEKLRELFKKAGIRPIEAVRKKDPLFEELGLGENSADETVIKALAQHPSLLQRPIVEIGDRAVIARPAEKALDLIAQARA